MIEMYISAVGDVGSGKTLLGVLLSYFSDIDVYANLELQLDNYHKLTLANFYDIVNAFVFVDEAYVWFESRTSPSRVNRFVSYKIFQARKGECHFLTTSQLYSVLDIRYRDMCNLLIVCERIERREYNEELEKYKMVLKGFKYEFYKRIKFLAPYKKVYNFFMPVKKAQLLYPLYNTKEIIHSPQIDKLKWVGMDSSEKIVESRKLAKRIKKRVKNKRITYKLVKKELLEIEVVVPKEILDLVYDFLQE